MAAFALGGPIMYIYGKRIRAWTAGRLGSSGDQMQLGTEMARGQDDKKKVATHVPVTEPSVDS
jgi:hypothetical protein